MEANKLGRQREKSRLLKDVYQLHGDDFVEPIMRSE